jgi:ferredoxin
MKPLPGSGNSVACCPHGSYAECELCDETKGIILDDAIIEEAEEIPEEMVKMKDKVAEIIKKAFRNTEVKATCDNICDDCMRQCPTVAAAEIVKAFLDMLPKVDNPYPKDVFLDFNPKSFISYGKKGLLKHNGGLNEPCYQFTYQQVVERKRFSAG